LTFAVVADTVVIVSLVQSLRESGIGVGLLFMEGFAQMLLHALATTAKLFFLVRDEAAAAEVAAGAAAAAAAEGAAADDAPPAPAAAGPAQDGEARFFVESMVNITTSLVSIISFGCLMKLGFPLYLLADVVMSIKRARDSARLLLVYRRLAAQIDRNFQDATDADIASDPRCAICYDDMLPATGCKRLGCGHSYHKACLRRWFQKSTSCPYCRKEVTAPAPLPANPARAEVPVPPAPPAPPADVVAAPLQAEAPNNAPLEPAGVALGEEMERHIREAYEEYVRMQRPPEGTQQAPTVAPSIADPHAASRDVAILRAQLDAYRAYRDEVEVAARRLDIRLAALAASAY
jgi:hypothetical protein